MLSGSRGIGPNLAYRNARDANQECRGASDLSPDREIHDRRVVRDGCPSVVKKTTKAESAVNAQGGQAGAKKAGAVKNIAQKTDRRDTAPSQADVGAGPRSRKVWILKQMLGVMCEVQQACRSVRDQQPRHDLRCASWDRCGGHVDCRLTVKLRGRPGAPIKRRGCTLSSRDRGAQPGAVRVPSNDCWTAASRHLQKLPLGFLISCHLRQSAANVLAITVARKSTLIESEFLE